MSLNKRSLRKDARPEPSLEDQLRAHERALKSRRGSNRFAAFRGIMQHDEPRAIARVEELIASATGKNREELGALLASTNLPRFVDAAAKGRYGDVQLHEHVAVAYLAVAVGDFIARIPQLSPGELERRAKALGVVPFIAAVRTPEADRALAVIVDDARLSVAFRKRAAADALIIVPELVWARRDDGGVVDPSLALAAGLATRYVGPEAFDDATFVASLDALPGAERRARISAARLPSSVQRFPAPKKLAILRAVLDTPGLDVVIADGAARELVALGSAEALEVVLARPSVSVVGTVAACARVSSHEAFAVLAPLLRTSEAARDALIASPLAADPIFVDEATALLTVDHARAVALLERSRAPRAAAELARLRGG